MVIGNTSDEAAVALASGLGPAKLVENAGRLPGVALHMAAPHALYAPAWRYSFSYVPADMPHSGEIPFVVRTWTGSPRCGIGQWTRTTPTRTL